MKPLLRDPETCDHPNPARRVHIIHEGYEAEETITKAAKDAAGAVVSKGKNVLANKRAIYIICALCGLHAEVSGLRVKDRAKVTAAANAHYRHRDYQDEQGGNDGGGEQG